MTSRSQERWINTLAHMVSQVSGWYDRQDPWWSSVTPPAAETSDPDIMQEDPVPDPELYSIRELHNELSSRFRWFSRLTGSSRISTILQQWALHKEACRKEGLHYVVAGDPAYPPSLYHADSPPYGLSIAGDPTRLRSQSLAIVGSRKASPAALRESYEAGRLAALAGWSVVSGGAYGCDISAHLGLLSEPAAHGKAIVIFAGGLNRFYPAGHYHNFLKIRDSGGALVSEKLHHQPAFPKDFPVRNRIICGLVRHVLVMQADIRSGAMITAKNALDQGREVLVLKLPESCPGAAGNHLLTEEGAPTFLSASEILGAQPQDSV
ncbi:MAG: DNA-protecting protein DprA [Deltaproteobacteria bacterium]|nr:DNA-protecting protein DprA [Deltaproteobacteria bacterium]